MRWELLVHLSRNCHLSFRVVIYWSIRHLVNIWAANERTKNGCSIELHKLFLANFKNIVIIHCKCNANLRGLCCEFSRRVKYEDQKENRKRFNTMAAKKDLFTYTVCNTCITRTRSAFQLSVINLTFCTRDFVCVCECVDVETIDFSFLYPNFDCCSQQ